MAKKQTWQQVYDDMQAEEKKQKWYQGWFQKGAFADGYQFGDVVKTYFGTRADVQQNILSAVVDATENLIDTSAYIVGSFGNKNFQKKTDDFIARDLLKKDKTAKWVYDYIPMDLFGANVWSRAIVGDDFEASSVLGEKGDGLVQSMAHQVGSRALNVVGVPWQLTTGVNSFGSELEEAFSKGAGHWEAGVSGAITAAAEIGSESLFGGSMIGEKGLVNLDFLTSGIKNKAIKALADLGLDMAQEGAEEIVSNIASSLGQVIYEADNPQEAWDVLQDKNSFDNLMTAFISGAAMSGIGNAGKTINSVKTKTDYRTGLTAEEQSVFDSVYESKVKEYEAANGKKPIGKAKKQLFTDTLNELNTGAVSIDAIGSVLDPETQKRYSEVSDELSALQQEYDQLYNMDDGEKTDAQRDRQADLKAEIEDLKAEQQELDSRLESLAQGTRMEESYRERARRGQKLQADPEQYTNSSASQTVRNIVDSGVMNNTNRSHEFVGLLAKISEDTGLVFSTTDAQRLKNTGFAVDGAVVNGYYTENGVAININSPQALETVVGHEVAHALEGSDFYEPLKNAVISFAKNKGEYKSLMDSLARLYTGKPGYETDFQAKMEKELVADLVGKYLFTDADFVRSLSVQNRNLFQRLFDEIKYLLRITKPGTKEAKQLEKIKKLFEEAYRDAKNTAPADGVKYSLLVKQTNGDETVVNANNITRDQVLKYMNMARRGQLESYTYFPVRAHTPSAIIATLRKAGITILDKPLAMQARKARQSQLDEVPYKKNGITIRHHAMNASEILEVIDKLDDPQTIIHQQDRTKVLAVDGAKRVVDAPDNFALFVTLDNGKECVAIIEFDSEIDNKYIIKDGNGDEYHTTVTVFEPDVIRNNEPFDYIEYLLLRGSNQELEIIKESSKTETAYSETHATVSEKELPKKIVPQKNSDVKSQLSLSEDTVAEQADGKNTVGEFDVSKPVEETADLLALHNITSVQLSEALSRNGLIMPSIAVTNKRFSDFGEISLIFDKDTIDPDVDQQNKLYGSDAWTPQQKALKKNAKFDMVSTNQIVNTIKSNLGSVAKQLFNVSAEQFIDAITDANGSVIDAYAHNIGFQAAYAIENGIIQSVPTNKNGTVNKTLLIEKLDSVLDTDDGWRKYRRWMNNLSDQVIQSYDAATNEDILNNMKEQPSTAKKFKLSESGELIVPAIRYGSIDQVRQNKSRLSENAADATKAVASDLLSWANKVSANAHTSTKAVVSAINAAFESRYDTTGIVDSFGKQGINLTAEEAAQLQSLYRNAVELPAPYFEAKPGGVVGFDQVKVAVVPNSIDPSLEKALADKGVKVVAYDPSIDGDRKQAVNQFDEYKFSLSNDDNSAKQTNSKNTYSQDVAVEQTKTETPEDVQQQITDLQGRLQQAVQDGDMDEAALIGKELYDLQHPDETLGTNENTDPGAQEDVPDPVKAILGEETDFLSKRAEELYQEIGTLKKGSGKRASATLSYLLDHVGKDWTPLKTALLNIKDNPAETVNPKSAAESMAREILSREYQESAEELQQMQVAAKKPAEIRTAKDRFMAQIYNMEVELATTKANKQQSLDDYNAEIAELEELYDSKAKKTTKVANDIKARIARTIRRRDNQDASYDRAIARLQESLARKMTDEAKTANQRQFKQEQYYDWAEKLVGDTSTWKDKKTGLQYMINTLRRNLRDIVKDEKGNPDYAKADAIYEELQGKYNLHEAELNRELTRLREKYKNLKITKAEDAYIQMLGEFRHNPQTTLSLETVENYYNEHKSKIDAKKVDRIIEMARQDYDDLIQRVNVVLREQGMKEIPYRKGYFPHFTLDKQGPLAKLLNWKTKNDDIPTDIAGLTEQFEPVRSYQSFNKQRTSDITDYSFTKGFDQYSFGALDWIYHIEDIQKRRALENYIRYVHSDDGVKAKIEAIKINEEYDADEAQKQIDAVYEEAKNPLNNFIIDLRRGTQKLAAKKSSIDREVEYATYRKIYSTMTNISNRVSANMVAGSISAALTNFIPITLSWGAVSPMRSMQAMAQTLRNAIRDDGMIDKSAFLTNRLRKAENLHKTGWDKASDKISWLMNAIDSFTSQTVWRSKYDANIAKGMSESEAIHDADLFAEGVLAGRSRGNMPTIFDSNNLFIKMITAFQLEGANQYGYLFKDMPQDAQNQNKAKLTMKYVEVFIGAYVYNSLFKAMTGRTAAFDPFRIIEELLRDVFDAADEEDGKDKKWSQVAGNFAENVLQEVPFVGGLLGGGRVPISSALPYDGLFDAFKGTIQDAENWNEGGWKNLTKEWLNPVAYALAPMAGGQVKKTIEGLTMFTGDKPTSGSYTSGGDLRFAVEPTAGNVAQAAVFGQWASDEAQQYIDEGRKPLSEKQTQEFAKLDIPIQQYWDIRDNLNRIDKSASKTKQADKVDYINSLDLTVEQKNILVNNILDRKENVDMTDYDKYGSFAEFDFYVKNPEKHSFLKQNGISYADYAHDKDAYNWAYENPGKYAVSKLFLSNFTQYYTYRKNISAIESDKDESGRSIDGTLQAKRAKYIGSLPLTKIEKAILMKQYYSSFTQADTAITQFISNSDSLTRDEKIVILFELGLLPDELNLLPLIGGNV